MGRAWRARSCCGRMVRAGNRGPLPHRIPVRLADHHPDVPLPDLWRHCRCLPDVRRQLSAEPCGPADSLLGRAFRRLPYGRLGIPRHGVGAPVRILGLRRSRLALHRPQDLSGADRAGLRPPRPASVGAGSVAGRRRCDLHQHADRPRGRSRNALHDLARRRGLRPLPQGRISGRLLRAGLAPGAAAGHGRCGRPARAARWASRYSGRALPRWR